MKQVRQGKLDISNVDILNQKVETNLLDPKDLDIIDVVQRNKHWHLINCMQIEQFARANRQTIIIFPAKHHCLKKDGSNFVQYEILFKAKDGEENCPGPGLLYYCKEMPTNILANQCTPLGIVNKVEKTIHGVMSHPNDKF